MFSMRVFLSIILQLFYKRTKHSIERATPRRDVLNACVFVHHLATVYKRTKHSIERATHRCNVLNACVFAEHGIPDFSMPLFGQKTGFRVRMNEIKSGIPCSVFLSIILQLFYKIQSIQSRLERATHRRNALNACVFVHHLATRPYYLVQTQKSPI
jgi:hypothetical protein